MKFKIIADKQQVIIPKAPRIIIVEDDSSNRKLLVNLLNIKGYTEVLAFESAEEALLHIEALPEKDRPQLIISDFNLKLAGMNGIAFVDQAKILPGMESAVALIMSGNSNNRDLLNANISGFLEKPFIINGLLEKIFEIYPHSLPEKARESNELLRIKERKYLEVHEEIGKIAEDVLEEPLSSIFHEQFEKIEEDVQHIITNTIMSYGITDIFDDASWSDPKTARANALEVLGTLFKMERNISELKKRIRSNKELHEQLPLVDSSDLSISINKLAKEISLIVRELKKRIASDNYEGIKKVLDESRVSLFSLATNNFTFFK